MSGAVQADAAGARGQHADQRLQQRGLAHAVAAHDGHRFVGRDAQGHIADDVRFAVGDIEFGDFEHF
jgi:hypothetical protein